MDRLTLVSFDVFDDRRRRNVRRVLRRRGDWFQQSLWVVERSSRQTIDHLLGDLEVEMADRDRAVPHRPCAECAPVLWWCPTHRSPRTSGGVVVS